MLWNDTELQNLYGLGKEIVVERFMKNLDAPENGDLFQKENFSYLWGLIGIAGIKGTSPLVRHKIWNALLQFGVVDAFDKGQLSDFNRNLAERYNDGRLKAWKGLDNFQASVKFRKTVLDKLVKTDADLAQQVSPYCVDYKKMMEQLDNAELNDKLKAYLERFRGLGAACGVTTDAVAAVYEKTDVLRKLCDVAAYTHRKLSEKEKNYLFLYLFEAVNDGFSPKSIGLDDAVLAKLMADEALDGLSELEAEPLLARNAEIEDFAAKFEDEFGFYEETEAKFIKHEFGKIRPITERCLKCIQKDAEPKGVVFAMTLVELNQIKSAVQILLELAKRGRATELIGFLHRLLPKVKGSESFILDIICINLQNFHGDDDYFVEYAARRTLAAVRTFIEANCQQQAAVLLKYLVLGNWFLDKNELVKHFILLANTLMVLDDSFTPEMSFLAHQLNLRVFETENGVIIGTDEDNPLAMAQQKLEQFVAGTSMLNWAKYAEEDKKRMQAKVSEGIEGDTCDIDFGGLAFHQQTSFRRNSPKSDDNDNTPAIRLTDVSNLKDKVALQPNIYKKNDEIVIPQKIQDKAPELSSHSQIKPSGKIPSSADILRSYRQTDISSNVVSELPSTQLREKLSEYPPAVQIDVDEPSAVIKTSHSNPINSISAAPHDDSVSIDGIADTKNTEFAQKNLTGERLINNVNHAITSPSEQPVKSSVITKQAPQINENTPKPYTQANVVQQEEREGITPIKKTETPLQTPDVKPVNEEVHQDNQQSVITNVAENVSEQPIALSENSDNAVSTPLTNADVQENAISKELPQINDDKVSPQQSDDENSIPQVEDAQAAVQTLDELPKFEEWESSDDENSSSQSSIKININNILNINSKEVDKHFEHIKQIASAAMKKAEEQAAAIKKKVEDADLANSPSVHKIKALAEKIKFFRKK